MATFKAEYMNGKLSANSHRQIINAIQSDWFKSIIPYRFTKRAKDFHDKMLHSVIGEDDFEMRLVTM